jgi:hypothetical protein
MEPQQPRPKRNGLILALAAAALLALGACALAYFVLQQRTATEPGLTLPADQTATSVAAVVTELPATAGASPTPGLGVAATATLPGEFATPSLPPPASDVVASRAAAPPTLDGDASEWAGLPVYSSPYIVFSDDSWDGSDDLAASWQVSWDDSHLYFIANVADDVHVQTQTGNQAFLGDSIELQIDADRPGDFGPALSPDDYQISLSPGDFGAIPPSAFRFQGTTGGEMLDAVATHAITVAAVPTGAGYILEAAIPWSDLDLTQAPAVAIGLAVNVNDNDRPGTAAQELMKSSAPNRRFADPTTWGTLTLQ